MTKLNSYSRYERQGIERAVELQKALGYPSRKELIHAIRNGAVINCTVTVEDILRAEYVHGKPAAELKGKTTAPANVNHRVVNVERSTERK